jgi:hypothetical protein
MGGRVVADGEARSAAQRMQSIIDNEFQNTINALNQQAAILKDPNHFDGSLAQQFRGEVWPSAESTLNKVRGDLAELRSKVEQIVQQIIQAGGG